MDFELTEEQHLTKQMVRDFAEQVLRPVVMEHDEAQTFPHDEVKKAAELDLLGPIFPEELGGAGLKYVDYVGIIEELSRVDPSFGLIVAAHVSLCSNHLYVAASKELRSKYLPPLAAGQMLGAWALTEPGSGSDASGLRTTAVRDGNEWVLNGSKIFVTNGTVAGVYILMAITDREAGKHGISAFLVEADSPGLKVLKKENKLGLRCSDTAQLSIEDCRVPHEHMVGQEGEGFIDALRILDGGRISIASLALGLAQGAYEAALKYSQEREQFNRPIAKFQSISNKLADMATEVDAARLLTYRAAHLKDHDKPVTKESAMAKLYAGEVCCKCAAEAVQVFGGYGFIKDFPAEKFYRDCKLMTIGEGTSEIQRLVIAREILS